MPIHRTDTTPTRAPCAPRDPPIGPAARPHRRAAPMLYSLLLTVGALGGGPAAADGSWEPAPVLGPAAASGGANQPASRSSPEAQVARRYGAQETPPGLSPEDWRQVRAQRPEAL